MSEEKKESLDESPSFLKFVYSQPYESTLLKLEGKVADKEYQAKARRYTKVASEIWKKHEPEVLNLFKEIYKIDIPEEFVEVFISLSAPNSFSQPMTISLKRFSNLEENDRQQRGLVYTVIHELAHYFLYSRESDEYANTIWGEINKQDLLGAEGTNLHFLIQAVEFGIIGEEFGEDYAGYARDYVVKNYSSEYSDSAQALIDHNVPLNKSCLEYIEEKILKGVSPGAK